MRIEDIIIMFRKFKKRFSNDHNTKNSNRKIKIYIEENKCQSE